ncbi:MAG: 4-(cytidine 5'-diphospho)-2-C-methyl-D-erythritol kinase [Acidobacteriota bacterium]
MNSQEAVQESIYARAYAKINWWLAVGERRADGYHDLQTLFQTIDLYDELSFTRATDLLLELDSNTLLETGDKNLVLRAARALQVAAYSNSANLPGAYIRLKKSIPIAAGLGGGSADAAVTLLALNQLWRCQLVTAELVEIAAQLGSDVPFFLTGGTAWGEGRGTQITPLNDLAVDALLLVNPGVEISTAAVYQEFDRLTKKNRDTILPTCSFPAIYDMVFTQPLNSLMPVVTSLYPVVAEVETRLRELGGEPVLMSGSGATVWARFPTHTQLRLAAAQLHSTGWRVVETRTVSRHEYKSKVITVDH